MSTLPSALKRLTTSGAVVALALCLPAVANVVVDDLEDGDAKNAYGYYWYSYQSGYATAITMTPTGDFKPSSGGANSSLYAASITFNGLGNAAKTDGYPEIAIGTNLTDDEGVGLGTDFNNVDSISFWAKGPSGMKFYFNVHTEENAEVNGNDNKYSKLITISGANTWARYSVSLKPVVAPSNVGQTIGATPSGNAGGLTQAPNYGTAYTFVPAKVTRLSWAIKKADNTTGTTTSPTSGTFAVDDVTLIGSISDPAPPPVTVCNACVSTTFGATTPSVLLADFTSAANALGYYSYTYANPGSTATKGEVGRPGQGNGLSAAITLGGTGDRYAGVGINLGDDSLKAPLNASDFTGIYFEYRTTGIEAVKVELVDTIGVRNPAGKDFFINLPGTNGEWKAAKVGFNELNPPEWVTPRPTFNYRSLAKLQIAVVGAVSGTVTIAVDNVYFLGASAFPGAPVPPVPTVKYALTYKVNADSCGWVSKIEGDKQFTITDSVVSGAKGPTVTAIANTPSHRFVRWDDDSTVAATRSDSATANKVFTAVFAKQPTYTVIYKAGEGGDLQIAGSEVLKTADTVTLFAGEFGPQVIAIWKSDYKFVKWDDGSTDPSRKDKVVDGNLTFTAEFVLDTKYVKVNYMVGADGGGSLLVGADTVSAYADSLAKAGDSVKVTAVPDSGYKFFMWSDNSDTTATRTDKYVVGGDIRATAHFLLVTPDSTNPDVKYFGFAYTVADSGGSLRRNADSTLSPSITISVVADSVGPTVTAVPIEGYQFVMWSDSLRSATRVDTAKANLNVRAEFARVIKTFILSYTAGSNGKLRISDNNQLDSILIDTVVVGASSVVVTAVPDSGYEFVRWIGSDSSTIAQRQDDNVQDNISVTAVFQKQNAVAAPGREIPTAHTTEIAVVVPVSITAGEIIAGPNPATAKVNFFRTGRAIKSGKLSVYDASGSLVTTINLSDKGNGGKRAIGSWSLKDGRGRDVANGSYAVRGAVTTKDGVRERVSLIIAVVR